MQRLRIQPIPLKRRILYGFHSLLHLSRIDEILSHAVDIEGAIILAYHSVASDCDKKWIDPSNHTPIDIFEKQMMFLARKRNVISLDSLIVYINEKKTIPRGTVIITFDDGYLDNLTNAAPVLKKYNLPATVYLATGYIERQENQWVDQLYSCFNERTKSRLVLPEINDDEMGLSDPASTWHAYSRVVKHLIECSHEQRTVMLDSIKKQLVPACTPPKLTMNWDDVRNLVSNNRNVELGSHTSEHIDISRIDKNVFMSEMRVSTEAIERETGKKAVHFSCPYSRTSDTLPVIIKNEGYLSSVSDSTDILINRKSDPYFIGRIAGVLNMSRFAHYTSGMYPWLSKKIAGRY